MKIIYSNLIILSLLILTGCGPNNKDAQALGFANVEEMKELQSQGFKTKKEYKEKIAEEQGFDDLEEFDKSQNLGYKSKDEYVAGEKKKAELEWSKAFVQNLQSSSSRRLMLTYAASTGTRKGIGLSESGNKGIDESFSPSKWQDKIFTAKCKVSGGWGGIIAPGMSCSSGLTIDSGFLIFFDSLPNDFVDNIGRLYADDELSFAGKIVDITNIESTPRVHLELYSLELIKK